MKLILLALVLAILYQIIVRALFHSREEGPRLRIDVEPPGPPKKSLFRIGKKQPEKDVTHRSRVLGE
jgi:hypothetical protein